MSKTLCVTTEQHYESKSGKIYVTGDEDRSFFRRYLRVFDNVKVIARSKRVISESKTAKRVSGDSISFVALPDFKGHEFIKNIKEAFTIVKNNIREEKYGIIIRPPGPVSIIVWLYCIVVGHKYWVELVTDPEEAFTYKSTGSFLLAFFRPLLVFLTKLKCRLAEGVSYVTSETLQKKYPTNGVSTHYSSVNLKDYVFEYAKSTKKKIKRQPVTLTSPKIIFVGRLHKPFKGLDILIKCVRKIKLEENYKISAEVVGGGEMLDNYVGMAENEGVAEEFKFCGEVQSKVVYKKLAKSDLFVLPSRREGLPRALIEAMAIGLPSIATPVGGIPELLPEEDLVPVGDVNELVRKVMKFVESKEKRLKASKRNSQLSEKFRADELKKRRDKFYNKIKNVISRQ